MRAYVLDQLTVRLRRLAFEAHRASKTPDQEAVHDLRVAIRRFSQALKLFAALLPPGESKRIRKRLRNVMKQAGEVRNRDITLSLAGKAGVPPDSPTVARFSGERGEHAERLKLVLRSWKRSGFPGKWLEQLS